MSKSYEIIITKDDEGKLSIRHTYDDPKSNTMGKQFTEKELKNLSIEEIIALIREADEGSND